MPTDPYDFSAYSDLFSGVNTPSDPYDFSEYADIFQSAGFDEWEDQGIFEVNKRTGERRLKDKPGALGGLSLAIDSAPGAVNNLQNIAEFAPASFGSEIAIDLRTQEAEEADRDLYANRDVPGVDLPNFLSPIGRGLARAGTALTVGGGTLLAGLGSELASGLGFQEDADLLSQTELYGRELLGDVGAATAEMRGRGTDVGGGIQEVIHDLRNGRYGDAVKDIVPFVAEEGANMLAVAPIGAAGWMEQAAVDTYGNLRESGMDVIPSLVTAGLSGSAQGLLEKAGWDSLFGKSAAGQWLASKVAAGSAGRVAAHTATAILTEGGTEALQRFVDGLAMSSVGALYDNQALKGELLQAVKDMPLEFAGGAVFGAIGGVAGNISAEARSGKEESQKIQNIIQEESNATSGLAVVEAIKKNPTSAYNASALFDQITELIEEARQEDESGTPVLQGDLMELNQTKTATLLFHALDKMVDGSIPTTPETIDEVRVHLDAYASLHEEKAKWVEAQKGRLDRAIAESAKLAAAITPEQRDAIGKAVDSALVRVDQYSQQEISYLNSEVLPTIMLSVERAKTDPNALLAVQQRMTQEWSKYFSAQEIANPTNIDWFAAKQRVVRANKELAVAKLAPLLDISLGNRHAVVAEGSPAVPTLNISIPQATQVEETATSYLTPAIEYVRTSNDTSIQGVKDALGVSERTARTLLKQMEERGVVTAPIKFKGRSVIPVASEETIETEPSPKMQSENPMMQVFEAVQRDNQNARAQSASGAEFLDLVQATTVGEARSPRIVSEALSNWSAGNRQQLRAFSGTITARRLGVEKPNIFSTALPYVKRWTTQLYKSGHLDLIEQLMDPELESKNTAALSDQLYKVLLPNAPVKSPEFAKGFGAVASKLFTPHSMAQTLRNQGVSESTIAGMVSAVHAMALQYDKSTKNGYFTFWERIADQYGVGNPKKSSKRAYMAGAMEPSGVLHWNRAKPDSAGEVGRVITNFGRRAIDVFMKPDPIAGDTGIATVTMHEIMHGLIDSGMLHEMLPANALSELQTYTNGGLKEGHNATMRAHEIMAYGFTDWLATGTAPNKRVEGIFHTVRDFFTSWANFLKDWVKRGLFTVNESEAAQRASDKFAKAQGLEVTQLRDHSVGAVVGEKSLQLSEVRDKMSQPVLDAFAYLLGGYDYVVEAKQSAPLTAKTMAPLMAAVKGRTNLRLGPAMAANTMQNPTINLDSEQKAQSWKESKGYPDLSNNPDLQERAIEIEQRDKAIAKEMKVEPGPQMATPVSEEDELRGRVANAVLGQTAALSLTRVQADAQLEAARKVFLGSGESALNTTGKPDWKTAAGIRNVAMNSGRAMIKSMFNVNAALEKWFHNQGLAQYALNTSTLNGIVDRANKVASVAPQVRDPITLMDIQLPNSKALSSTMHDIGEWAKELAKSMGSVTKHQVNAEKDLIRKDLDLYLTAKRQLEISQNWIKRQVAYKEAMDRWELSGKPDGGKPAKPVHVNVSKHMNAEAHIALAVMKYKYGDKVMEQFDHFAKEIAEWGKQSIIDKLKHYGMISPTAHKAMRTAGTYWIPLEALSEEVINAGIPEPIIDQSLWNAVHYLQNDTGSTHEDYLEAMIKRAVAVEKITHRQIAKNKIGQVLMQQPLWWNDLGGFKMLTTGGGPKRVAHGEWILLPDNRRHSEEAVDEHGIPETRYYRVTPMGPQEFNKYMQNNPERKGRVFAMTVDGDKQYIEISDPQLMDAINGMSEVAAEHASRIARNTLKVLEWSKTYNRNFVARAVTTSWQFISMAPIRDAYSSFIRSRFGLGGQHYIPVLTEFRLVGNFAQGLMQSAGVIFPSLAQRNPEFFAAADSWYKSSSGMSTLGAQFHEVLKADMESIYTHGKSDASKQRFLTGIWNDLKNRVEERGVVKGKRKFSSKLERLKFTAMQPLEAMYFPFEMMSESMELSWRLRERQLGMRQQFRDAAHKSLWQVESSKMARDHSYVPNEDALPLLPDAELDYGTRNITIDFGNKGSAMRILSSLYIFINPMYQDVYSSMKLLKYGDVAGGKTGSGFATKKAMGTFLKAFGLITLPALAEWAKWKDDDDWRGLPFHEKVSYIHASKNADGRFTRYSSGLSMFNLIFRDGVMAALLDSGENIDPNAWGDWAKRMTEQLPGGVFTSPALTWAQGGGFETAAKELVTSAAPASLEGIAGLVTNRDPFTGRPTKSPDAFNPQLPEERNKERYTWFQNRIAGALSIEPQQAAFLMKKYLPGRFRDPIIPGTNTALTSVLDQGVEAAGMRPSDEAAPTSFTNVGYSSGNPFVTRPQYGPQSEWVQDLNMLYSKVQQVKNTVDAKRKAGQDVAAEDIIRRNPVFEYYEAIKDARENVTDLFAARRALMLNSDMSDDEKRIFAYSEYDKPASSIASSTVREVLIALEGK